MNDDYDDDFDEPYDEFEDAQSEVIDCPSCGADVYEDAEQCPVCGDYIVADTNYVWAGRPLWWLVLGAAGILAVIAVMTLA